jgi:hypothetical protein
MAAPIGARCRLTKPALLAWLMRHEQQQEHSALRLHFLAWVGCLKSSRAWSCVESVLRFAYPP